MSDDTIIVRYLIKKRNDPFGNSNDQRYICGYLAGELIDVMDAEELPEFLTSPDVLIREYARDRIANLMGW